MKIAAAVSRILLGRAFQDVFFKSGWVLFVDGVELISGLLVVAVLWIVVALPYRALFAPLFGARPELRT